MTDLVDPLKFSDVLAAVKAVCGFNESNHSFTAPSLCLKLGHAMKKCALIVKAGGLQRQDDVAVKKADEFVQLCKMEWSDAVSSHAIRTMQQRQWNAPKRLPIAEDISKLRHQIDGKSEFYKSALEATPDARHWHELAKVTLVKVMLFNRRRSGEIERIPLTAYQQITNSFDQDVVASLSQWEQELCRKLSRMEIRGKRGRKVPVLLTEEMKESIDMLVSFREKAGVDPENKHLFACPTNGSMHAIRGAACLRTLVQESDLKHPESITSTKMRKHIATMAQVLTLRENELDILARFMGHDVRIHREYYRLPEDALQVAKVSKVLMAMDRGNVTQYYGKTLDDLNIGVDGE
jgi:isopentenyldiphosphate isomerase